MPESKSFLDNLKNLRLVLSVALEHVQTNRNLFVNSATASQFAQFDRLIAQIRTHSTHLEKEFNTLEYLIAKRQSQSSPVKH